LTLHGAFSRLLAETPTILNAVAVIHGKKSLTFSRLDQMSDYVMTMFHSENDFNWPSNFTIAIAMKPSLESVPFLLGILKLGAAYVPINPFWNDKLIAETLEQTKPKVLVCDDLSRFASFSDDLHLIDAKTFLSVAEELLSTNHLITITYSKSSLPAVVLVDHFCADEKQPPKVDRLSHQLIMNRLFAHWTKLPYASDEVKYFWDFNN
jgi:non-ribosomal peptide synthetase component F